VTTIGHTVAVTPAEETREKKLRTVESAAASAMYNGATPEQVRDHVEVGIAEVLNSAWWKAQQDAKAAH
jgi:hypothetical protein